MVSYFIMSFGFLGLIAILAIVLTITLCISFTSANNKNDDYFDDNDDFNFDNNDFDNNDFDNNEQIKKLKETFIVSFDPINYDQVKEKLQMMNIDVVFYNKIPGVVTLKNITKEQAMIIKNSSYTLSFEPNAEVFAYARKKIAGTGPNNKGGQNLTMENRGENSLTYVLDTGVKLKCSCDSQECSNCITLEQDNPNDKPRCINVIGTIDFTNEKNDKNKKDDDLNGHGTHVASTIEIVASKMSIFSVKVLNGQGSGTTDAILEGINFVYENIENQKDKFMYFYINMSLGMSQKSQSMNISVNNCVQNKILSFVAAGNDGKDFISMDKNGNVNYGSPASAEFAITVGSLNDFGTKSAFSSSSSIMSKPEISTFGEKILAVNYKNCKENLELTGTSMATPAACGVVASAISESKIKPFQEFTDSEFIKLIDTIKEGPVDDHRTGVVLNYENLKSNLTSVKNYDFY